MIKCGHARTHVSDAKLKQIRNPLLQTGIKDHPENVSNECNEYKINKKKYKIIYL